MDKERIAIFIDGSNFYHGLKRNIGKTKIDFSKLAKILCGERKLIRIYYYTVPRLRTEDEQKYQDQQKFLEKLKITPYLSVELGRMVKRNSKCYKCNDSAIIFIEKGIDVKIATDMLRFAYNNSYDTAIIISGDGDFSDAIKSVQDLGKHVENAYFKKGHSDHLRQTCDKFILLDENILKDCFLTEK